MNVRRKQLVVNRTTSLLIVTFLGRIYSVLYSTHAKETNGFVERGKSRTVFVDEVNIV